MAKKNEESDRELVVTRLLNAPRELVFKVWTEPRHIAQWWGPDGFTNTIHEMDVRPGGMWRLVMHGPNGMDFPNKIVYTRVVKPERLEYTHGGDDDSFPHFHVTVTFDKQDDKTQLTMRMVFPTSAERDKVVKEFGALEGQRQTIDRLEHHLSGLEKKAEPEETAFEISREFNAPRELVYKAFTDVKQLAQWWGPKGFEMVTTKLDLRPGGMFHYCMKSPDGQEIWGRFIYREIVKPERIVFINSFSDAAGNITRHPMAPNWPAEVLNTLTLSEHNGKTLLTLRGGPIHATQAERAMFKTGAGSMQQGFKVTFDQLETFLSKKAI